MIYIIIPTQSFNLNQTLKMPFFLKKYEESQTYDSNKEKLTHIFKGVPN